MCYSQSLKRDANAYEVKGDWILTGWKSGVVEKRIVPVLPNPKAFEWVPGDIITESRSFETREKEFICSMYQGSPYNYFTTIFDKHGIHCAATRFGAMRAPMHFPTPLYTRFGPQGKIFDTLQSKIGYALTSNLYNSGVAIYKTRAKAIRAQWCKIDLLRVLVLEKAVGQGEHCHVVMYLPKDFKMDSETLHRFHYDANKLYYEHRQSVPGLVQKYLEECRKVEMQIMYPHHPSTAIGKVLDVKV